MNTKLNLFSVSISTENKQETLKNIEKLLYKDSQRKIFTPNTEMLLAARRDLAVADMLNSADLLIPDGTGIKIASHFRKNPIPERISGIDTAEEILTLSERQGFSVFLLGGRPTVAERAAKNLQERLPMLNICGTHHGYFEKSGEENREVIDKIQMARPDILFVCFGFPLQERWICENISALPSVRIAMGLGGSLDIWSGSKKRAPEFIQAIGLEWLWRSVLEPKRLKIFLEIPEFLYFALKER